MSNYIKDPEEVLKQRIQYRYSLEEFPDTNISSVDVIVLDSSNNDVTSGIIVDGSIDFDNNTKEVEFYIQGGVENAKFIVKVTTTFSNSLILSDDYIFQVKKQPIYMTKSPSEKIPVIIDYREAFGKVDIDISSYTVEGFKNGVLMNYVSSTSMVDKKITAMVQGGSIGERLEIVFKVIGEDLITTLVDRIYMDIK